MSEKLLEIKNLHVMYKTDEDDVYALNGINLELDKGETLGLVGETRSGKEHHRPQYPEITSGAHRLHHPGRDPV